MIKKNLFNINNKKIILFFFQIMLYMILNKFLNIIILIILRLMYSMKSNVDIKFI